MPESFTTRLHRTIFNLFPAYRRTGGRVIYMAADLSEVRVKVPFKWRTRNIMGSTFGGTIYGAVDPIYMMILIRRLGKGYIVWDKSAHIRFKKPARGDLFATFTIDDRELRTIKDLLETEPKIDRTYTVELVDKAGVVHATVEKVVHVRRSPPSTPLRTGSSGSP